MLIFESSKYIHKQECSHKHYVLVEYKVPFNNHFKSKLAPKLVWLVLEKELLTLVKRHLGIYSYFIRIVRNIELLPVHISSQFPEFGHYWLLMQLKLSISWQKVRMDVRPVLCMIST